MSNIKTEKKSNKIEQTENIFENCPINYALGKIGGKWKPVILHRIKIGINRFGALQRAIPQISKQMLTSQLRELEQDGFIERKIFAEIPPRVEYSISNNGETVFAVLDSLANWGIKQMRKNK